MYTPYPSVHLKILDAIPHTLRSKVRSELARHMATNLTPEIPPDLKLNSKLMTILHPVVHYRLHTSISLSCLYFALTSLTYYQPNSTQFNSIVDKQPK